jgi:hypothetical protein
MTTGKKSSATKLFVAGGFYLKHIHNHEGGFPTGRVDSGDGRVWHLTHS